MASSEGVRADHFRHAIHRVVEWRNGFRPNDKDDGDPDRWAEVDWLFHQYLEAYGNVTIQDRKSI